MNDRDICAILIFCRVAIWVNLALGIIYFITEVLF